MRTPAFAHAAILILGRPLPATLGDIGKARKPRPTPGQRQVQVILGGSEPVQQHSVPGRRHLRRLLGVGVAETIGIAAEKPAAFAHAPPGPLAVRPDAPFRRR
jgi:hypothetical protein